MRAAAPSSDGNDVGISAVKRCDCRKCSFCLDPENRNRPNKLRAALPGNDDIAASYFEAGGFVVVRNLHGTPSSALGMFGPSVREPELPEDEPEIVRARNLQVNAGKLIFDGYSVHNLSLSRHRNSNSVVGCDTHASGLSA